MDSSNDGIAINLSNPSSKPRRLGIPFNKDCNVLSAKDAPVLRRRSEYEAKHVSDPSAI